MPIFIVEKLGKIKAKVLIFLNYQFIIYYVYLCKKNWIKKIKVRKEN